MKTASRTEARPARKLSVVDAQEQSTGTNLYRCPGCGDMVDGGRLSEVLAHHQHVLHPAPAPHWFEQKRLERADAATSVRGTTVQRAPSAPNENYAMSSAARLRRYGHS